VAKRVHVFISGQVQGVGFRWFCREEALRRRLAGFVRNLPDGRVEAAFEGEPAAVDQMVEWCRGGPDFASVSEVDVSEESPAGDARFVISR
jgi:acylphosphatase